MLRMKQIWLTTLILFFLPLTLFGATAKEKPLSKPDAKFKKQRKAMIKNQIEDRGIKNKMVLQALNVVERHLFVPKELQSRSYGDHPLPIGFGQTISQPYIVAYMTEKILENEKLNNVLEIGTGSGYQAAVLSHVSKKVYSIEIIQGLYKKSTQLFNKLGFSNIHTKHADGYYGWKEHAPFDAIVVTAASADIPPLLIQQLAPNGRMIIPVGTPFGIQYLMEVTKDAQGKVRTRKDIAVAFVPLVHGDKKP